MSDDRRERVAVHSSVEIKHRRFCGVFSETEWNSPRPDKSHRSQLDTFKIAHRPAILIYRNNACLSRAAFFPIGSHKYQGYQFFSRYIPRWLARSHACENKQRIMQPQTRAGMNYIYLIIQATCATLCTVSANESRLQKEREGWERGRRVSCCNVKIDK